MERLAAWGTVIRVAAWVAVVNSEQQSVAFHFECDFGFRSGYQAAFVVENLNGQVRYVSAIRGDRVAIRRQTNRGWLAGSKYFHCGGYVPIFDADGLERSWLVGHIP